MKPTTTEEVFDLMDAYATSAALNAALELGLFWLLAEGPMDARAVAQMLDIPVNRCQYWLQLLHSLGLLSRSPEGYAPSSTALTAILDGCSRETWTLLAKDARDRFPAILDLALHLSEPGSIWAAQGRVPPDYFAQMVEDPERARRFTHMLYELHLPLAQALAGALDLHGVRCLLDLGGGSGVMSMALLRQWPNLKATVVDIANVCLAGREIARDLGFEAEFGDRLSYAVADFECDELPGNVDLVLQCDVGGYGKRLLGKIREALNPGGRLIIVDHFASEPGLAPDTAPHPLWAFLGSLEHPDLTHFTMKEIQARLVQVGFRLLSTKALPQRGASRWTKDWVVVEVGK